MESSLNLRGKEIEEEVGSYGRDIKLGLLYKEDCVFSTMIHFSLVIRTSKHKLNYQEFFVHYNDVYINVWTFII